MRLLFLLFYISISCFSFASEKKVANTAVDTAKVAIGTNVKTRLGNGLTSYINCKYLSYKYNVPFLYQPFPYSDQFSFHDKELSRAIWEPLFKNNKQFEGVEDFNLRSTFLVVPFFRDGPLAHRWKLRLYPDLKDPVFLNIVREMLQPRLDFETLELPKNKVNVVLHVRRGGDFDNQQTIQRLPLKFPSDAFFIDNLKKLSDYLNNAPIYAHIMTDDLQPKKLLSKYRKEFRQYPNITFGYKKLGVMEDFFSIPKFDCIIRGDSTFSIVASLLGEFMVSISVVDVIHETGKKAALDSQWDFNYQHPYFQP